MNPIIIMPCLDMKDGRVVKGVRFVELRDAGDLSACARTYDEAGADELALLDIAATREGRQTMLDAVRRVADACSLPLTAGGGVNDCFAAEAVLEAGAKRVSVASAAFRRPETVREMVRRFGEDTVTVAIDIDRNDALPSGYEVFVNGGQEPTGADALDHAKRMADFGVSRLLPTSKAADGALTGYDLPFLRMLVKSAPSAVVASGGAGTMDHFLEAAEAGASALLAASVFHFGAIAIPELKDYLEKRGIAVQRR